MSKFFFSYNKTVFLYRRCHVRRKKLRFQSFHSASNVCTYLFVITWRQFEREEWQFKENDSWSTATCPIQQGSRLAMHFSPARNKCLNTALVGNPTLSLFFLSLLKHTAWLYLHPLFGLRKHSTSVDGCDFVFSFCVENDTPLLHTHVRVSRTFVKLPLIKAKEIMGCWQEG